MNEEDCIDLSFLSAGIEQRGLSLGEPINYLEATGSTNADAMAAASAGAPHGAIFLADHQTLGRGRLGRTWLSPPKANLTFSLVLRPTIPVDRLPAMTPAIGMGVVDGISRFIEEAVVGLKWPNDVLIRSKKVAGILVEGALSGARCEYVVAGIGINVLQTTFDPSIEGMATSMIKETDRAFNRNDVLLACLSGVAERLEQFERAGLAPMMSALEARDLTKGRTVRFGETTGVADGIELDGRLRVQVQGRTERLHSGEVEILS